MCHALDRVYFPGLICSPYDKYYRNKIVNFQEAMTGTGDNLLLLIAWHAYLMHPSAFLTHRADEAISISEEQFLALRGEM